MDAKLRRAEGAAFLFSSVLAPLEHFLFAWCGSFAPVGALCPVNESVWEHMKLLFFPAAAAAAVEYSALGKEFPAFIAAKAVSLAAGLSLVPVLFYTLNGAFGKTEEWVNIALYYVALAAFHLLSLLFLTRGALQGRRWRNAAICFFLLAAAAFALLTYFPPQLPLFQDPATGGYGIPQ